MKRWNSLMALKYKGNGGKSRTTMNDNRNAPTKECGQ